MKCQRPDCGGTIGKGLELTGLVWDQEETCILCGRPAGPPRAWEEISRGGEFARRKGEAV